MKNLPLLLLFLFTATGISAQGQTPEDQFKYRATYTLTYQPNSEDEESRSSETMHLYLGEKISKFMSRGKDLQDSIKIDMSKGFDREAFQDRAARTKTEFDYVIYKNVPQEKISFHLQILRDHLKYENELALFDWTILPESQTINGYQVQKATTSFAGREYTAWFTPEIPRSEGPYKFNGLPGLILQIKDSRDHYVFELDSFEELKNPVPFVPEEKALSTTKDKMLQAKRQYAEDPFRALENSNTSGRTITIEIDEKEKQKMLRKSREELARKNNPLELK